MSVIITVTDNQRLDSMPQSEAFLTLLSEVIRRHADGSAVERWVKVGRAGYTGFLKMAPRGNERWVGFCYNAGQRYITVTPTRGHKYAPKGHTLI